MARIPLNGQSYESASVDVNVQRTVNWYPEVDPTGKNNLVLFPMPGYDQTAGWSIGAIIRGMLNTEYGLIVVAGADVFQLVWTAWGTGSVVTYSTALTTSSGNVSIATNGESVLVADGANGCLINVKTQTLTSANINTTDADYPEGADAVCFIDGYFVVNDPNNTNASASNGGFFISGLYNGASWAALDYDVADRKGDQIKALINLHGQLWLVGSTSTEVWYNSGNPLFPFERVNGAVMDYGTYSGKSVVSVGDSILMLAKNEFGGAQVMRSNGYNFMKVSTFAIDHKLQELTNTQLVAATAFVMQFKGHNWYCLTAGDNTLVYDFDQNMWFEWCYSAANTKSPALHYAYFLNEHVVGLSDACPAGERTYLQRLDDTVYSHNSAAITRLRQSPHFHMEERSVFCSAVHLKFEQGVGTVAVPNPQVMLQWSDDGGHTWGTEYWRSILGATGEYNSPAAWRRLGRFYDRVWRIKMTDAVKAVLIDAYMVAGTGVEEMRK